MLLHSNQAGDIDLPKQALTGNISVGMNIEIYNIELAVKTYIFVVV